MTEILNSGAWILEELPQPANSNSPPAQKDARRCYWLICQSKGDSSAVFLHVYSTDDDKPTEKYSDAQIFRLSFREHDKDTNSSSSSSSEPKLQAHESPNIGTKLLFEDELIKIWEFRLAPGERCVFHRHVRPYFFLNLTASTNQELNQHGEPVPNLLPSQQTAGQCTFVTRDKLAAHAVRNVSDNIFLQFIVEFKNSGI